MSNYINKEKDKGLLDFFCPMCGHNKFNRTPRNFSEKMHYYFSIGSKANKKFECNNCGWTVLLGKGKRK